LSSQDGARVVRGQNNTQVKIDKARMSSQDMAHAVFGYAACKLRSTRFLLSWGDTGTRATPNINVSLFNKICMYTHYKKMKINALHAELYKNVFIFNG